MLCINYDKNRDRSGTGAKPVKTASFFIKTGFSFVKNGLDNRLRPGCTHHRDDGCGRGADPGLREAVPGMQRSLSAIPGALLCPVFASYPAKRGIFNTKTPPFCQWLFCLCKHKQCIIIHINKHSSKKHDGRMEPSGTITLNFLFSQPYI